MEVEVSQLIPGCIIREDVLAKTNYPMINKDTVLNEEHILILKKFLIKTVRVSRTLANGKKFRAKAVITNELLSKQPSRLYTNGKLPFHKQYAHAITKYKEHFSQWQHNVPINILEIREFILPLIESTKDMEIEIYKLHQYATKTDYFYHHCISVAILSSFLARKMGFEKGESIQIGLAGFLSNIGMAKINPKIIKKSSSLSDVERDEVKKHPTHSYLQIKSIQIVTESVKLAVLQHHERLDGSGYPLGLKDKNIHQYARIIAVCDTYHAMTSDRLYQPRQSPFKVMNELKKSQFMKLDSLVVQTFIQSFINLSLGEKVKLTNKEIGKITFIDKENLMSPLLLLENDGQIISLKDEQTISIIDFL